MIENSGLKMSNPHEDLEISDCWTIRSEVAASMRFEPLL
jgi:hypothetical protein